LLEPSVHLPIPRSRILRAVYYVHHELNQTRQGSWDDLSESALWVDLMTAILDAGVKREVVFETRRRLQGSPAKYAWRITAHELRSAVSGALTQSPMKYPFPGRRTETIGRAAAEIYAGEGSLTGLISGFKSAEEGRRRLMSVPGVGPKVASMFLRNIGYSNDLAIIDRHILRYMSAVGVASGPWNLSQLQHYSQAESELREHANAMGLELGDFDRAAWIVARALRTAT
jgi:N-glycosylase/DNA lyase